MANFLKLNKSYLGPEVLSNGSFNGYGPEKVTNGDFATNIEGWTAKDSSIAYDNGKLKVTSPVNQSAGAFQNIGLVVGGQYEVTITMQILSGPNGNIGFITSTAGGTSQSPVYKGAALVSGGPAVTETFTFTPGGAGGEVSIQPQVYAQSVYTIDNISVKQTGIQELVTNGFFTNVAGNTVVTTLSQWTAGSPNLVTATITNNVLTCTSNANNQHVLLQLPTVVGTEYKFNIKNITGGAANSINVNNGSAAFAIDTTGGSADATFTALQTTTNIVFYAGDRVGADTTTYSNISLQPTNQFAYGYERDASNSSNAGGINSVFNFSDKTLKFTAQSTSDTVIKVSGDVTTANEEYLIKIDVESISGDCDLIWFNGNAFDSIAITVGENEYRYKKIGSSLNIFFGIKGEVGSSFTLNSVSLQEVVNQPKLIGVDNISMVSAPTVNTVKINNGLTDGADTLTITYVGASASSKVQMRNFFQDSIISLANGNNTDEVLEITPPVLITDIVAS